MQQSNYLLRLSKNYLIMARMGPAKDIIRLAGGAKKVASWCDIACVNTVYYWTYPIDKKGTDGWIPHKYHRRILEGARESGIDLRPEDFFAVPDDAPGHTPAVLRASPGQEAPADAA